MTSQAVVVDAANVVGSRPDGWWRDRAGAARRLLVRLAAFQERLQETTEVVVILEGAARSAVSGPDAQDVGTLRVVLAGGSGDDTIVSVTTELTTRHNPTSDSSTGDGSTAEGATGAAAVVVVTADRGLRQRVEAVGATTVGPRWLLNQLDS
jgi:hypothetical protein